MIMQQDEYMLRRLAAVNLAIAA